MTDMADGLKIDIWSDIACPWCYIGKRKLDAGLTAFLEKHPGTTVEIELHSFELAPDTPVDFAGTEVAFLAKHKGLPEPQVRGMIQRVTDIAAEVGLRYDFDALQHTNSLKAHQLLHYAKAHGKQLEVNERLMSAYFVEGRHVGRDESLADLAAEVGLDRDDVLRSLAADEHLAAVNADKAQAVELGVTGVPFFLIDRKYALVGAQPPETFVQALSQAHVLAPDDPTPTSTSGAG